MRCHLALLIGVVTSALLPTPARAADLYSDPNLDAAITNALGFADSQVRATTNWLKTTYPGQYNRSITYTNPSGGNVTWNTSTGDWARGYYPATMWRLYEITGDTAWRTDAKAWSTAIENKTGDFGNFVTVFLPAYREAVRANDTAEQARLTTVLLNGASAKVGVSNGNYNTTAQIFGYDKKSSIDNINHWQAFVDHMPDLELMFWAANPANNSNVTQRQSWEDMSKTHLATAAQTMLSPMLNDGSGTRQGSNQRAYFDYATGQFLHSQAKQGWNHDSTWSRGQSWALYGFATAYEQFAPYADAGDQAALATILAGAKEAVDYTIANLPNNLPGLRRVAGDYVPQFDYDYTTGLPFSPRPERGTAPSGDLSWLRDTGAGAMALSGMLHLIKALPANDPDRARYWSAAMDLMDALTSSQYLAQGTGMASILNHSCYNFWDTSRDVGTTWGDYYFVDALGLYKELSTVVGSTTWTAGSGAWTTDANWDHNRPTSGQTVNLSNGSAVTLGSGAEGRARVVQITDGQLHLTGGRLAAETLNAPTLGAAAVLFNAGELWAQNINLPLTQGGGTLAVREQSTTISGTYDLQAGSAQVDSGLTLTVQGTLQGAGSIVLAGSGSILRVGSNGTSSTAGFDGVISGLGQLIKEGAGVLALNANQTYTGATTVSGGELLVSSTGDLAGGGPITVASGGKLTWDSSSALDTARVTVAAGGTLGGAGSLSGDLTVSGTLAGTPILSGTVGGSGLVSPGNSPGITTVGQVDPTGGLDFSFEFTAPGSPDYTNPAASVNDVLRITDGTTPFTASLTAANVVDVYLAQTSLSPGHAFRGGWFTDLGGDFLASIQNATVNYWVKRGLAQPADRTFNGNDYYSLANWNTYNGLSYTIDMGTVADSGNFPPLVNGRATQFSVVPEPSTALLLGLSLAGLWRRRRRRDARSAQ